MAAQPLTAAECLHYAQVVGDTFVEQYYNYLRHSPELVYRFYQESSRLGRPDDHGNVTSVTTVDAINETILSAEPCTPEIKMVNCQDSLNGGVTVLVRGFLTWEDNVKREFIQSFFLAPQEKGYFVLNDILMYVGEVDHHLGHQGLENDTGSPLVPPEHDSLSGQGQTVSVPTDEVDAKAIGICNPPSIEERLTLQEPELDSELIDEVSDCYPALVKSKDMRTHQEMCKKSYASVVKVTNDDSSISAPARFPSWAALAKSAPAPPASGGPNSSAAESNNFQKAEFDGNSIYVKNLPLDTTLAQLEEAFKRFGPIKPGGIQVKAHKLLSSCFGFVEFKFAGAARSAIEASPIIIADRRVYVEEKRMVGSGVNSRGRFPPSKGGGHQNDETRERGSYGGWKSYDRNGFDNRRDFAGRTGNRSETDQL